jgi:hypothetical protein
MPPPLKPNMSSKQKKPINKPEHFKLAAHAEAESFGSCS